MFLSTVLHPKMSVTAITLTLICYCIKHAHAQSCAATSTTCDWSQAITVCGAGNDFCGFNDCSYNCDLNACVFGNGACGCDLGEAFNNCPTGFIEDFSTCTYSCPTTPTPSGPNTPTPTPSGPNTPTPTPTPSGPNTPTPTPSNGCIASHQTVIVQDFGTKKINDLSIGDKVFTDEGFKEYIGDIHNGGIFPTLNIFTVDKNNIEVTPDHFVKTNRGFLHAEKILIGEQLVTKDGYTLVTKIVNATSYVVSPLTRSGTIIVNNIVLSCYATDRSHEIVNLVFLPVRVGIIKNTKKYFKMLVNIYNTLPVWFKIHIYSQTVVQA